MPTAYLDATDKQALADAVAACEAHSSIEVVVAIRRHARVWWHVHVGLGVISAFAALGYMLFARFDFGLTSIWIDPFVAGLAVALLSTLFPPLVRGLTPPRWRRRAARLAAEAVFYERGVHLTTDRTGLLLYVALVERAVVILPDRAVSHAWPADRLRLLEAQCTQALTGRGRDLAAVVHGFADEFARVLPQAADDRNELPDAPDARMSGRWGIATARRDEPGTPS